MKLVPLTYNFRSLMVRRSATMLTVLGIGATVAVLAGVLSLQQGFVTLFSDHGRADLMVFLRPGATSEGDSMFDRDRALTLMKSLPDFRQDENEQPMASLESYLAVRRFKLDGGETNVPIRGVQPMSFKLHGNSLRIIEGRMLTPGTDEVIVGKPLVARIENCQLDDIVQLNTTPFRVVGVFEHDGPYESEIWGDVERMASALEWPVYNRVIGVLREGTDSEELAIRLENHPETPAKLISEKDFLLSQTQAFSIALQVLAGFLSLVMGIAAIFTATNTMLSAIAARTQEIGILLSIGFRPFAIFLSFLMEAALLGLIGGAIGCLLALPINGIRTGTTNFQTFTEVAFAFRITPNVLMTAVGFAVLLGLIGGMWPAWRAARMQPTDAMRRA